MGRGDGGLDKGDKVKVIIFEIDYESNDAGFLMDCTWDMNEMS